MIEPLTAADVAAAQGALQGRSSEPATETTDTTTTQTSQVDEPNVPRGTEQTDSQQQQSTAATTTTTSPAFDIKSLGFNTPEEITAAMREREELRLRVQQLAEYESGPKFADPRSKLLFDYANQVPGMGFDRARQMIDIIGLDLNNAPAQRVRFEAFKLEPSLEGLSQDEVQALFEADEKRKFGSPTEDEDPQTAKLRTIQEKQATEAARRQVQAAQQQWNEAAPVMRTPEEIAQEKFEYQQRVGQTISNFNGIDGIKLKAKDAAGAELEGTINFKVDEARRRNLQEAMNDLPGWWERKMTELGIYTPQGTDPDLGKMADFISRMEFQNDLLAEVFQAGVTTGATNHIRTAKKLSDPSEGIITPAPQDAPVDAKKDMVRGALGLMGFSKVV